MKRSELEEIVKGMAPVIRDLVEAHVQAALTDDALRARGYMKFAGVYQRAQGYEKGAVVTHQGASWVALKAAAEGETPGSTFVETWQLLSKSAR